MKPKLIALSAYLGIFLIVGGISYYLFSLLLPVSKLVTTKISPTPTGTQTKTPGILSFEGPKTEVCPLNGALYTKEEANLWSSKRPLTIMIENHADSRPQSGLGNADIVYEAIAEGGITRFLAVYYCAVQKGATQKYDIGPVRSARTYFLDLASEYSDYPLYTHVGGANCSAATPGGPCTTNRKALALEQIDSYGWTNKGTWSDMNEFSLSYKICRREPERTGSTKATEHTMYCSTKELWNMASARGLTNITTSSKSTWDKKYRPWQFNQKETSASASSFSFDFWSGYKDYAVTWNYDSATNSYLRSNGNVPHIDFNTNQTLSAKNVIIEYVKESRSIDEHLHNLYEVIGTGKGVLFQNGIKTDITWTKSSRQARTVFKNTSGKEVNFVPGPIWIEILPINSPINYAGSGNS